jgi:hypothetical protein
VPYLPDLPPELKLVSAWEVRSRSDLVLHSKAVHAK